MKRYIENDTYTLDNENRDHYSASGKEGAREAQVSLSQDDAQRMQGKGAGTGSGKESPTEGHGECLISTGEHEMPEMGIREDWGPAGPSQPMPGEAGKTNKTPTPPQCPFYRPPNPWRPTPENLRIPPRGKGYYSRARQDGNYADPDYGIMNFEYSFSIKKQTHRPIH